MEKIQIQTPLPTQLNLRLSEQGELQLSGTIENSELQAILDSATIRQRIYLEHQAKIERESNQASIYIGFLFSGLIGLLIFCLFNQNPQTSTQSQSFYVRQIIS